MVDPVTTEKDIRKKFRTLADLWETAKLFQSHSDGNLHRQGDGIHAQALALENELVALCLSATASEKDAARYRWLLNANPSMLACIAWSVPAACAFSNAQEAIDAAMEKANG